MKGVQGWAHGVEAVTDAAGINDAGLNLLRQLIQVHVARIALVPHAADAHLDSQAAVHIAQTQLQSMTSHADLEGFRCKQDDSCLSSILGFLGP